MNTIKVEVTVRLPDSSTVTEQDVVEAVEASLNHMEEYDDQSLWRWHEYELEVKDD